MASSGSAQKIGGYSGPTWALTLDQHGEPRLKEGPVTLAGVTYYGVLRSQAGRRDAGELVPQISRRLSILGIDANALPAAGPSDQVTWLRELNDQLGFLTQSHVPGMPTKAEIAAQLGITAGYRGGC